VTQSPVAPTEAPAATKRGVEKVPWYGWLLIALFGFVLLVGICYLALSEDDGPRSKPSSSDMPDKDGDNGSYEPPGGDGYLPPGGDAYGDTMDTSAFRIQPPSGNLGVVQENGENQEDFQYGQDDEEDEDDDEEEETYEEETYEEGEGDEYEDGEDEEGDDEEYEDGEEYEEGDEEYEEGEEDDEEYDDEYEDGEEEP
jgi:hypothetical protein